MADVLPQIIIIIIGTVVTAIGSYFEGIYLGLLVATCSIIAIIAVSWYKLNKKFKKIEKKYKSLKKDHDGLVDKYNERKQDVRDLEQKTLLLQMENRQQVNNFSILYKIADLNIKNTNNLNLPEDLEK